MISTVLVGGMLVGRSCYWHVGRVFTDVASAPPSVFHYWTHLDRRKHIAIFLYIYWGQQCVGGSARVPEVQSVRYVCTPATTWRNDRDRNARDGPFWVGEVQCDRVTAVSSVGGEGAGCRGGETRRHGTWRAEGGPPLR